jgi:hypothetical protein
MTVTRDLRRSAWGTSLAPAEGLAADTCLLTANNSRGSTYGRCPSCGTNHRHWPLPDPTDTDDLGRADA